MSHQAGLAERFVDLAIRQELGIGYPSRFPRLSTARTSSSNLSSDGQVRELLGQAGLMTHRTGLSEQLIQAVQILINWSCLYPLIGTQSNPLSLFYKF
ncbi:hypothetical protein PGT21_005565 [Puccinia graminis f. sp. tritici]|uniref:Uncharacterized protein n=1 Tax=Puccinia graminis f. sp. tritici TaxID=56615 RepID=A0A5B0RCE6_PUCGR|nr:hypothetical protein PGT21_005565 [Puccinia graminis f. sp. tritici]KAA1122918.1 hypothetical protein PGTUg99_013860 [Puccinia graminis f. sp. tritici]